MADIVDLNSRRPLPEAKEVLKNFDTLREWMQEGYARSYAFLLITADGRLITSHYALGEADQFVIDPFLSIYSHSED